MCLRLLGASPSDPHRYSAPRPSFRSPDHLFCPPGYAPGSVSAVLWRSSNKRVCGRSTEDNDSEDDEDEDDDEEISEESEPSEEGEEEEREVYDVDICPAGCSVLLYTRVCSEREKRVDIEEVIAEERATREALLKDLEQSKKRAKIVVDLVEEAEEELEAFQVPSSPLLIHSFTRATLFPAYSWVLAKRLLSGPVSGWLVGKWCLSRVSLSVRATAAEGRQARVCVAHGRRA